MTRMNIEPLSAKHVPYVANIIKERWGISDEETKNEIERWMSDADNSICFVGIIDDTPVAFGLFDVQSKADPAIHSWNRQLWVEPAYRGSDYGNQLTLERFAWARKKGYESVYLSTETAKGYHSRFGWEVVKEEIKPDKTITIMRHDLSAF